MPTGNKHSPAPFKVVGPYQITVLDANDKIIGDFMIRVDYSPEETCAANARLFEAAPEMLEVLKEYVSLFETFRITNPSSSEKDFAGFLARTAKAAITKATGEAP